MGSMLSTLFSVGSRQRTSNSRCQHCMHRHRPTLPNNHLSSSEQHLPIPESFEHHPQGSPAGRGSAPPTEHDRWITVREAWRGTRDRRRPLEQIYESLANLGLESPKPIFGIDFTKSNEWTGKFSFSGRCLHDLGYGLNPYEQVISNLGRSLSFARKNPTPCYGFGDATTNDKHVFGFYNDEQPCRDIDEALSRYREIVPGIKLAGPTSFAPIIEKALTKVKQSDGLYHILFIIVDGQITRSVNTGDNELSSQEKETMNAIVRASKYPLSIFVIGVGDGPWDFKMEEFRKHAIGRDFDNFTFINSTEIMTRRNPPIINEMDFDLLVWQTICAHYRTILELGILRGYSAGKLPKRLPVPYPTGETSSAPPFDQLCDICFENVKDVAFGCGHLTCCKCGERMTDCPMCRTTIEIRIKLHPN